MITAEYLRLWRVQRNLTQLEAAKRCAVSKQAWQHWEAGDRPVPGAIETIIRLSERVKEVDEFLLHPLFHSLESKAKTKGTRAAS